MRRPWVRTLLVRLFLGYTNLVHRTTRWSYAGTQVLEDDVGAGRPRVVVAWHSRLAMTSYCRDWTNDRLSVLASYHRDAQILTRGLEARGINVIELLTTGDNTNALRAAVKELRDGRTLGIAPDGPMGPREYVKPGAIVAAQITQAPVCALAYSVSWKFRLKTWDRFVVPLPFGRGVFVLSEGQVPPRRMNEEQHEAFRIAVEDDLNRTTAEADRMVAAREKGHPQPAHQPFGSQMDRADKKSPA